MTIQTTIGSLYRITGSTLTVTIVMTCQMQKTYSKLVIQKVLFNFMIRIALLCVLAGLFYVMTHFIFSINTSILKDIRCTKLSLKSDRMRRYLTQSKHHRLANSKRNAYDTKALLALIEAARYSLVDTSETLLLTVPASDRLAMSRKLKHKTTATLANEKRASARHKKKIRKRCVPLVKLEF